MPAKVTVKDRGYRKRLAAIHSAARQRAVTVGVHEDDGSEQHEDSDLSIVEVATIHEFGAPGAGIPRRSFIRDWFDESRDDSDKTLRSMAAGVVAGKIPDVETALNQFGAKAAGDVKKRIIAHIDPPNAEATIARKGSSTPLIGKTTQLLGAITWKVET